MSVVAVLVVVKAQQKDAHDDRPAIPFPGKRTNGWR
jgi:hypothetical protein